MATAGPAHRVASANMLYAFPQGHLGHLSSDEQAALDNFKALLIQKGLYKPKSDTDEYGTHDDATLLRFLRARRFQVQDAVKQFKDTEDWRISTQLDRLYATIDVGQYEETWKLYPQWTGRRDRRGIPVYVYEVRHLNSKTMAAYEKSAAHTHSEADGDGRTPARLLRLFALYENLVRFAMPLCTALSDRDFPETPITQSNNIVDISGVGLKQFWNLRAHMQDASTLATAHYPETLDRIFIIGAPAFFPTVWGWIKRWFDPITTSKIFILSQNEVPSTLRKFIDPANIPKKYGGDLDFEFGKWPSLDPALKDVITWEGEHKDFPQGPLMWHDRGEYIELEAVGSVDKQERREMICKLRKQTFGPVYSEKQNGNAMTEVTPQHPTDAATTPASHTISTETTIVVEAGETVPASRPEPASFVTASEDLKTLSIKDDGPTQKTPSKGAETNTVTATEPPLIEQPKDNGPPSESATQHEETLTKVKTGEHSVNSKGSLESGKKSNKTGGLKKMFGLSKE